MNTGTLEQFSGAAGPPLRLSGTAATQAVTRTRSRGAGQPRQVAGHEDREGEVLKPLLHHERQALLDRGVEDLALRAVVETPEAVGCPEVAGHLAGTADLSAAADLALGRGHHLDARHRVCPHERDTRQSEGFRKRLDGFFDVVRYKLLVTSYEWLVTSY